MFGLLGRSRDSESTGCWEKAKSTSNGVLRLRAQAWSRQNGLAPGRLLDS